MRFGFRHDGHAPVRSDDEVSGHERCDAEHADAEVREAVAVRVANAPFGTKHLFGNALATIVIARLENAIDASMLGRELTGKRPRRLNVALSQFSVLTVESEMPPSSYR